MLQIQLPWCRFSNPLLTPVSCNRSLFSVRNSSATSSSSITATEPKQNEPWLIVGLGNPGKIFAATRHNVGFEMVDAIAEAEGISMNTVSFKALIGKGFIGDVPVLLAKPQTFMNLSGESVGAIVSYYKIPLKQVLVIFDDLDLPFAKLRLLPKGGHGGHNGMKSVINHLKGNDDFPRLRMGIGRPAWENGSGSICYSAIHQTRKRRCACFFSFLFEVSTNRLASGTWKS